ncbi:porin [uncultured Tenacibaculum sp.]|uniref:porin n=1 Tax=uncultured Tenacibaculum sp. TaxID=174713 RepID=UPI0026151000|nr:porin [uncultured Tenacibaculum sp.]
MKLEKLFIIISMLITLSIHSQKLNAPKFGNGLFNLIGKDSTWSMNASARIQFLTSSKWDSNSDGLSNNSSAFQIRRARLKLKGFAFSPKLKYKIELGFSNSDIGGASEFTNNAPRYILDAVVKWNFYQNFELWIGQAKLPGNRERIISSGNMQFVDRSLLNAVFNIDRDLGFQLRHQFHISEKFIIKETFAFSQGEGRNVTTGNIGGYQYTAHLELFPFGKFTNNGHFIGGSLFREDKPKLAIGMSYDFNDNAVKDRSNLGTYMKNDTGFYETDITTYFLDAIFKYKNFSFMGEFAHRNAKNPIAKNSDGSLTGDIVQVGNSLNLQTGYLFPKNWELSGRYTNVSFSKEITNKNTQNQYTIGLSKYISGHKLKVQTDVSYLDITTSTNQLMYRLQIDVHF